MGSKARRKPGSYVCDIVCQNDLNEEETERERRINFSFSNSEATSEQSKRMSELGQKKTTRTTELHSVNKIQIPSDFFSLFLSHSHSLSLSLLACLAHANVRWIIERIWLGNILKRMEIAGPTSCATSCDSRELMKLMAELHATVPGQVNQPTPARRRYRR